jgi:hypothetical protein
MNLGQMIYEVERVAKGNCAVVGQSAASTASRSIPARSWKVKEVK